MQRQGRGLGAVWACASKHWHNIEGGGGGGGGGVYSMLLTDYTREDANLRLQPWPYSMYSTTLPVVVAYRWP